MANPANPVHTATITGPAGGVFSVNLRPDGQELVAGGVNDTIQLWGTNPIQAASWLCSVAAAPIAESEWQQYLPGRPFGPPCDSDSSSTSAN